MSIQFQTPFTMGTLRTEFEVVSGAEDLPDSAYLHYCGCAGTEAYSCNEYFIVKHLYDYWPQGAIRFKAAIAATGLGAITINLGLNNWIYDPPLLPVFPPNAPPGDAGQPRHGNGDIFYIKINNEALDGTIELHHGGAGILDVENFTVFHSAPGAFPLDGLSHGVQIIFDLYIADAPDPTVPCIFANVVVKVDNVTVITATGMLTSRDEVILYPLGSGFTYGSPAAWNEVTLGADFERPSLTKYAIDAVELDDDDVAVDWLGCTTIPAVFTSSACSRVPPEVVTNTTCDTALLISTDAPIHRYEDVRGSTQDASVPAPACAEDDSRFNPVWFKFIPDTTGDYKISAALSSYDALMSIGPARVGELCLDYRSALPSVPVSTNTTCGTALSVTSLPFQLMVNPKDAPQDPIIPTCNDPAWNATWWKITVPSGVTNLFLTTAGSDYDTVLSAYSGSCGSLVELDCDDDGGPGTTSELELTVTPGAIIYVLAAAYSEETDDLRLVFSAAETEVDDEDPAFLRGIEAHLITGEDYRILVTSPTDQSAGEPLFPRYARVTIALIGDTDAPDALTGCEDTIVVITEGCVVAIYVTAADGGSGCVIGIPTIAGSGTGCVSSLPSAV